MTNEQYEKARTIKGKLASLNADLLKYEENEKRFSRINASDIEEKNGKWKTVDLKLMTIDLPVSDFRKWNDAMIEKIKYEINILEGDFRSIKATN